MQLFDKRSIILLLLITVPLLFIPKINLLTLQGQTAGIRIDDLLLFSLASVIFWAIPVLNRRLIYPEKLILALTGCSILSFLVNQILVSMEILDVDAKVFYCLRLLEYFLFFYMGTFLVRFMNIRTIFAAFLL